MDTFMDQLSQKLNAQQIIRANGEAESEAMGVMRAQVREYQECLDRMKTVADELGGLQQTIAALPDLSAGASDSALEGLKEEMASMNRANEDHLQQLQNNLLAGQNDFIARQQDLAQSQNDFMNRQSEMLESRSNELKEQIEAIRLSNEEHLEKIRNDIAESGNDDLKERLNRLEAQIGNQLGDLKQEVSLQIDAIKAANDERLDRIGSDIAGSRDEGELNARLDRLEAQIGSQFTDLRQDISTEMEIRLDDLKQGMNNDSDSRFGTLKEDLKNDLASNDNEELNARLDRLEAQIGSQLTDLKQGVSADIETRLGDLKQGFSTDIETKLGDLKQGMSSDIDTTLELLKDDFGTQLGAVRTANEESLSKLSGELVASSSDADIMELIEVLRDEVSAMKLQMENVRSNNDQYLQQMQSNLRKGQEQMLQSQSSLSQALGNADIHKECVRVYRNVQASIQDENAKQLESIRQENAAQLESIKTDSSKHITIIKDESAKLLGSLRNDSSKQLEGLREENSKFLVNVKSETSKIEEQVKGVKKLAIFALIASILSILAPFIARFLM